MDPASPPSLDPDEELGLRAGLADAVEQARAVAVHLSPETREAADGLVYQTRLLALSSEEAQQPMGPRPPVPPADSDHRAGRSH